uniref:COMM domain containing 4 n=1 Tax=Latimeria chalumnae TaxID=7897 RepID=H3BB29_LATCH
RFRFCGDLDCPDWVLAEISTLAKISSVKVKLLCAQVLKDLLGEGIDVRIFRNRIACYASLQTEQLHLCTFLTFYQFQKVAKLTSDAKFETGDVKASVAVLSFILSSAAKHSVDSESLSSELQQLGLPKEHTTGLCKTYEDRQNALQERLRECSLRLNKLDSISWRVDYTLSSSELKEVNEPVVHLRFNVRNVDTGALEPTGMSVGADKFRVLLAELKQAQAMMNAL